MQNLILWSCMSKLVTGSIKPIPVNYPADLNYWHWELAELKRLVLQNSRPAMMFKYQLGGLIIKAQGQTVDILLVQENEKPCLLLENGIYILHCRPYRACWNYQPLDFLEETIMKLWMRKIRLVPNWWCVPMLHFCNHVNLIAVSEHHHHHNSNSKTLQLSIIIIIPLRWLGHFPKSIPELLRGHDYSESIIKTLSSLSYLEFITGISYVNGIQ